ncbi:MAG: hypothetical protein M1831_000711 [Alyxoria varia]|nr:MAG: hypothetical protein M1831_000711 [Alyxoria varia]
MSRPSTYNPSFGPGASTHAQTPTVQALTPSIPTLRTCNALLSSTITTLNQSTADLPRLSTTLSQTRHFELAPSSALASAQENLVNELKPEVEGLLGRVEKVLERRERREEWLRARWALGEGRLGRDEEGPSGQAEGEGMRRRMSQGRKSGVGRGGVDEMKAKRVRQKKERLSYAVERLQLQAGQRERQLRMSMAVQERQDAGGDGDEGVKKEEEDEDEFEF